MSICALCRKEISPVKPLPRRAVCPHCKADLHICLNCGFYSETAHNKCKEVKAEFQRTRDKANFCDYFVFSESNPHSAAKSSSEDARKKFEDLFRR